MFSTNLEQAQPDFDETIHPGANDFEQSGLRVPSVIRVGRLAVVSESMLIGAILPTAFPKGGMKCP
jgi:mRNA interferase MazF